MNLKGKTVMVAGATGGLGQAVVMQLAELGCSMMLIHHANSERVGKLRTKLKERSADVWFYSCDFTSADDINDATEIFFDQAKSPYALINLIGDPARVDWQKAQINHMQESFLKNASAPLHSAKTFALNMPEQSIAGSVVLFSSTQGIYTVENSLFYGTPKSALIHGAKILAKDFGGEPFIRINVIAPGVNQAGMAEESIKKGKYKNLVDQKIVPRYGDAANIG